MQSPKGISRVLFSFFHLTPSPKFTEVKDKTLPGPAQFSVKSAGLRGQADDPGSSHSPAADQLQRGASLLNEPRFPHL